VTPMSLRSSTVSLGSISASVAAWLRDLGLERYEPTFRDNGIVHAALPIVEVLI
jgi:hypothetical protein